MPVKRSANDDTSEPPNAYKLAPPTDTRVTRSMATAVVNAFLGTSELVENLFLHLDIKTAFAARRVCHKFNDTVAKSLDVQEHMFLLPSSEKAETWALKRGPDYQVQVPVRLEDVGSYFTVDLKPQLYDAWSFSHPVLGHFTPIRLNPVLRAHLFPVGTDPRSAQNRPTEWRRYQFQLPYFARETVGEVVHRMRLGDRIHESVRFVQHPPSALLEEGAWNGLHLTKPSCNSARIKLHWYTTGKGRVTGSVVRDVYMPGGLTFGGLIQAALSQPGQVHINGKIRGQPIELKNPANRELLDVLELLEKQKGQGRRAIIDIEKTVITLWDVVVPTDQERRTMRQYGDSRGRWARREAVLEQERRTAWHDGAVVPGIAPEESLEDIL